MNQCFFPFLTFLVMVLLAPASLATDLEPGKANAGDVSALSNTTEAGKSQSSGDTDSKALPSDKSHPPSSHGAAAKESDTKVSDSGNVSLPLRFTSLVAGIVVGAPIASVRRALSEDAEAAQTVMYGKKHSGLKMAARVLLLPVCLLPGAFEGMSDAVENSCKYCGTKPLSKKSFSLGKLGADEN